jgi:plastocyanin
VRRVRKILILLGVMAIVAVGCGGGSSTTASASSSESGGNASQPVSLPGQTNNKGTKSPTGNAIDVEMDDFYFSPTFIQGTPGQALTLHLKNEGKNAHTFTSTSLNVDQTLQPGQDMDVKVTLPQAGATEFHCNFHQSQGMQGAFFFNSGDVVGGAGAGAGASASSVASTSSSSSSNGGYNYPT